MLTLAFPSCFLSDWGKVCNHSFLSSLSEQALPWELWLHCSRCHIEWMAHLGLSRTQVTLRWSALLCPAFTTQRSILHPWLFRSTTLSLGTWEQNQFLDNCGKGGEERGAGPQVILLRGLRDVGSVALERKTWWKENFSQKPYIMELPQAGESERQMAMSRQMHHRDKAWVGGCEEAEAIGSSGQREKAHTVELPYGKLGWETEDGTTWRATGSHQTWSQG